MRVVPYGVLDDVLHRFVYPPVEYQLLQALVLKGAVVPEKAAIVFVLVHPQKLLVTFNQLIVNTRQDVFEHVVRLVHTARFFVIVETELLH